MGFQTEIRAVRTKHLNPDLCFKNPIKKRQKQSQIYLCPPAGTVDQRLSPHCLLVTLLSLMLQSQSQVSGILGSDRAVF